MSQKNQVTEACQSLTEMDDKTEWIIKKLGHLSINFEETEETRCQLKDIGGAGVAGSRNDNDEEDFSSDFSNDATDQLSNSQDEIPMGLFNVRSINNKQPRISEFIKKFSLRVLTLTETWVKPNDGDQSLGEALPEGFEVDQEPRPVGEGGSGKKRGGGVATLYFKNLKGGRDHSSRKFESFEYVATDLRHDEWTQPMWAITIYRPPTVNKKDENHPQEGNKKDTNRKPENQDVDKFKKDFQLLLNKFPTDESILITGDFNIRVNQSNNFSQMLEKLLEDNGLIQHVKEETHQKHNTLDLVITRNVDISNLRVKKPKTKIKTKINKKTDKETQKKETFSDHYAVLFSARPTS